jgi:hypothetical protein
VRKGEKVTERKMDNMHLLKSLQVKFKCGIKIGGKGREGREKGRKERWAICIY